MDILKSLKNMAKRYTPVMEMYYFVLSVYRKIYYKIVPGKMAIRRNYIKDCMRVPDFEKPDRFTEKMWALKLINGNRQKKLLQKCYDKYNVRDYIRKKLGNEAEHILNEVYGIYNSAQEIDFDALPDSFVLKVTQSSGSNIIVPDKSRLDIPAKKKMLSTWLWRSRYAPGTGEECYLFDGHPRIICEKLLLTKSGEVPYDLRVFCFHGVPKLFWLSKNIGETSKWMGAHGNLPVGNTYDTDWNLLNVDFMAYPHDRTIIFKKPDKLDQIVQMAETLSEDFIFTRVDFLMCDETPYFGELTFVHNGGKGRIVPDRYDEVFGSWLDLDKYLKYVR